MQGKLHVKPSRPVRAGSEHADTASATRPHSSSTRSAAEVPEWKKRLVSVMEVYPLKVILYFWPMTKLSSPIRIKHEEADFDVGKYGGEVWVPVHLHECGSWEQLSAQPVGWPNVATATWVLQMMWYRKRRELGPQECLDEDRIAFNSLLSTLGNTARGMYQRQKVRVWADTGRRAGKVVSGDTFRKQQDIIKGRLQWWGPYESANAQPSLPHVAGTCDKDVKTALLGMRFP
ncbi:hypothetical protein DUNSADRAFT_11813 [Dunaliella salina]|uniref:Uncharacterized protein n=1 Tax=Dunaliella salina TaxID=3046 RepID=A0ABQ7FTL5_DUNSA|nr:hypothetical protein DUNSADRAFT_11813 [Dunaliella salina]|eukprot:KAF5825311.1 hypothetical protein DUNSADRAFT_11813 [Dunaliella salina]